MSEPRTLDEWRRAVEVAEAELAEANRQLNRPMTVAKAIDYAKKRHKLKLAAEDARLGLDYFTNSGGASPAPPTVRPAAVARRARGRPAWTASLFDERLAEAIAAAGGSQHDLDVAPHFRGLTRDRGGEPFVGIDPHTLARLRQRRARGRMSE